MSKSLEVQQTTDKERVVTITTRHIGVDEEWKTKEEIAKQERESMRYWKSIDDENRAAILILMRDALLALLEDPQVWVPMSMEASTGHRLDILLSISLPEVNAEVLRRRLDTEKLITETCTDLASLRSELQEDDG